MQNSGIENPPVIFRQDVQSGSMTTTASSLAIVLDIILSTQQAEQSAEEEELIDRDEMHSLRLVCKATRDVIDSHRRTFTYDPRDEYGYLLDTSWRDIAVWPWTNVTKLTLLDVQNSFIHRELEHLVTLPLQKLESLELECYIVQPLVNSNWPMLTKLDLQILIEDHIIDYPEEFKFPKWHLKELRLGAKVSSPAPTRLQESAATFGFVSALMDNCTELVDLVIRLGQFGDEKAAEMILTNPLKQLESLYIESGPRPGFYSKLFEEKLPALRVLTLLETSAVTLALLSSQIGLLKHIENLHLIFTGNATLTGDGLRTFLKVLENGVVEKLSLLCLHYSIISDGFKGIKLPRLKMLRLARINTIELNREDAVDVSECINLLFEICLFPELKEIDLDFEVNVKGSTYYREEILSKWSQAPNTGVKQLVDSLPLLQNISLSGLDVSQDVVLFLGCFRKQTGCEIGVQTPCQIAFEDLSPDRKEFLDKFKEGVDSMAWVEFCKHYAGYQAYQDCVYFNLMPEVQFKRIAFAAVLEYCTDVTKLENFLKLVEAEEEGMVMTAEVLQHMKDFLERLKLDHYRLGVEQQLTWRNVESLIDFKMQQPAAP